MRVRGLRGVGLGGCSVLLLVLLGLAIRGVGFRSLILVYLGVGGVGARGVGCGVWMLNLAFSTEGAPHECFICVY